MSHSQYLRLLSGADGSGKLISIRRIGGFISEDASYHSNNILFKLLKYSTTNKFWVIYVFFLTSTLISDSDISGGEG